MQTYLVGYGTLLNRGSLGDSIGRDQADSKPVLPVIVKGYKRLFNLRPSHYSSSNQLGMGPIENAAMNVEKAQGFRFNGLAFPVTEEELVILDERERYYERKSGPIYAFSSDQEVGQGHYYTCPADAPWIEPDTSKLMPLWRDIVWARSGAYRIGQDFGRCFDETTYLADGTTLMVDYYRPWLDDELSSKTT